MEIDINKVKDALLDEMTKATKIVLERNGIERRSNLVKSVEWESNQNGFVLIANDYYSYRSTGRRRGARKVPIADLLDWMKRYGIRPTGRQTVNQLAFAIQTSIFKSGIKGLDYEDPVEIVTLDISSEGTAEILSEVVADAMLKSLTT